MPCAWFALLLVRGSGSHLLRSHRTLGSWDVLTICSDAQGIQSKGPSLTGMLERKPGNWHTERAAWDAQNDGPGVWGRLW